MSENLINPGAVVVTALNPWLSGSLETDATERHHGSRQPAPTLAGQRSCYALGDGVYLRPDESQPLTERLSSSSGPRLVHYFLLGGVVLGLGFNWPILDRGVELISPLWLMTFRLWGGALVGFGMNAVAGQLPRLPRRDMRAAAILGVFRLLAIFVFVFFALQILPPGRSGILVWTGTLWAVPIAWVFLGERMSGMQTIGLVVGMSGMAVVVEPWGLNPAEPSVVWGYLMLMGAALSAAWTSVYMRGHRWASNALASTPWQMLAGGIPALAAALLIDGLPDIQWNWLTGSIVAYEMTIAGPLVVWAQLEVFRSLPAISVNLTLMATPVVALVSSWWLAGEMFTAPLVIGLILITGGVAANILSERRMRFVRTPLT